MSTTLTPEQQALVERHLAYGCRLAIDYFGATHLDRYDRDDVFAAAWLGLCNAARKWQPARGAKFATFAAYWVKCQLHRYKRSFLSRGFTPKSRHDSPFPRSLDAPRRGSGLPRSAYVAARPDRPTPAALPELTREQLLDGLTRVDRASLTLEDRRLWAQLLRGAGLTEQQVCEQLGVKRVRDYQPPEVALSSWRQLAERAYQTTDPLPPDVPKPTPADAERAIQGRDLRALGTGARLLWAAFLHRCGVQQRRLCELFGVCMTSVRLYVRFGRIAEQRRGAPLALGA